MPFIPSAAQILSSSPTATSIFGTGADGDVTIAAGTTTLTRDMQYNNLVVNGTLSTAGFRVFIRGTLTGAGTITYVQDNNTQTGSPGIPYNDTPGYYNIGLRVSQRRSVGEAAREDWVRLGLAVPVELRTT